MRGAVSELVVYPEEGHVVGDFPAVSDAVARTVAWFERHMPA
jgi:dipeptidyl aminopeptidase/acylaminoacyl peptidase